MTTVISRLFPDEATARSAVDRLIFKGVPARECDVFVGESDAGRLEGAMVHPDAASSYVSAMNAGHALVVVRTTYRPLGAAKLTREVLAERGGHETAGITEDYFSPAKGGARRRNSVLRDHPRVLTSVYEMEIRGPVTDPFMRTLSAHKTSRSAIHGGRYISRAFWPMKLVSHKTRKSSVMHGGGYMSRMFWPGPLLSGKPRRKSVMPGGGLAFARLFGVRTIIAR